jgi:hypothetical protein
LKKEPDSPEEIFIVDTTVGQKIFRPYHLFFFNQRENPLSSEELAEIFGHRKSPAGLGGYDDESHRGIGDHRFGSLKPHDLLDNAAAVLKALERGLDY